MAFDPDAQEMAGAALQSAAIISNATIGNYLADHMADDGATAPTYSATQPNSLYLSQVGKTVTFYESLSFDARKRAIKVSAFDHSKKVWEGPYLTAVDSALFNDDHGNGAGAIDHQGYIWVFGGSHYGPALYCSVSIKAYDPSAWVAGTSITRSATPGENAYCYPFAFAFGQQLGVITRRDDSYIAGNQNGMVLAWRKSTALNNGAVTWASDDTVLVNLGSDTRVYHSTCMQAKNGELYISATRANIADSLRQDVFVFILNPFNGSVRSIRPSGSVVSQANLPIIRSFAESSFREVDQSTGGFYGSNPVTAFDLDGNYHLIYMSSPVNDPAGAYDLIHKFHNGAAWSATTIVGTTTNRYTQLAFGCRANGELVLTWSKREAGQPASWRTGNLYQAVRSVGGAWGAPTKLSTGTVYTKDSPCWVKNGRPELELIYGEQVNLGVNAFGTGGAGGLDAQAGVLRMYGRGKNGILPKAYRYAGPTLAWADRLATAPTDARLKLVDALISRLINANVWEQMDGFYLLAAADAATAYENLKSSRFRLKPVGGLTFTVDSGIQGDGTTGYLDTGFNPARSIDGCRWAQDNAHMSVWSLTEGQFDQPEIGFGLASGYSTFDSQLTIRNASKNQFAGRLNAGGTTGVGLVNASNQAISQTALGHFLIQRGDPSGSQYEQYFEGERQTQNTGASNGVVDGNLTLLKGHNGTAGQPDLFSSRKLAFASFGGGLGLTNGSRAKVAVLRNALRRYLFELGGVSAE